MMRVAFQLFLVFALLAGAQSSADVRLVDAAGDLSSVGLLQVSTDAGFGTVCGANAAAADATRLGISCLGCCLLWLASLEEGGVFFRILLLFGGRGL